MELNLVTVRWSEIFSEFFDTGKSSKERLLSAEREQEYFPWGANERGAPQHVRGNGGPVSKPFHSSAKNDLLPTIRKKLGKMCGLENGISLEKR